MIPTETEVTATRGQALQAVYACWESTNSKLHMKTMAASRRTVAYEVLQSPGLRVELASKVRVTICCITAAALR